MAGVAALDYILSDCSLAVGQAVGTDKAINFDAVRWWHERYRLSSDTQNCPLGDTEN